MNANEYLAKIDPAVQARLTRAINSLLNAGRSTGQVRDALSIQASFGKYDGCHPTAILEIAADICNQINREHRTAYNAAMKELKQGILQDLPSLAPFIR